MESITINQIADFFHSWAPWDTAQSWDNVGVLVRTTEQVNGILCALDITKSSIAFAKQHQCNVIVTHHPVLFRPQKQLHYQDLCVALIQNQISAIAAHTNLDCAKGGVSDILAQTLQLQNIQQEQEFLYTGSLPAPITVQEFARHVSQVLNTPVQYTCPAKLVQKIGVISGAGGSLFSQAIAAGCDCFVTGEANHHHALDAAHAGLSLVVATHFATERIIVPVMAKRLKQAFPQCLVLEYTQETPPFSLLSAI